MYRTLLIASMALYAHISYAADKKIDFRITGEALPQFKVGFATSFMDQDSAVIGLSDGSEWMIRYGNPEEVSQWKEGDEIRLERRCKDELKGRYLLKNARTQTVYLVDLYGYSPNLGCALEITKADTSGYVIRTQEGSEWVTGWMGACIMQYWKPGQRVLINKGHHSTPHDYLLINLDDESDVWATRVHWK